MAEYFSDVRKELWTALLENTKRQSEPMSFEELFVEQKTLQWLSAQQNGARLAPKRDFDIFAFYGFRTTKEQDSMRSRLANFLLAQPLRQPRGWVCQRCSFQSKYRWQSTQRIESETKPYYITSPIFYVNGGKTS